MAGKRILVVLSNESFLPAGGKGSPPYHGHQPQRPRDAETEPSVDERDPCTFAPSSWSSATPATHAPTAGPAGEQEFEAKHRKTGADILEIAKVWCRLAKKEGRELTFCSPRGGAIAIDPLSIKALCNEGKELADRIWHDSELMGKINHTIPTAWVNPKDYDMVIIPGSHAAILDLPHCSTVAKLISAIYAENGVVAAIGHGVAALLNVREPSGHGYLIKGKRIACFTREEEQKMQLEKFIPWSVEDKCKERGAQVQRTGPFEPKVIVDKQGDKCLVTAQSYPSANDFIEAIIKCTQ